MANEGNKVSQFYLFHTLGCHLCDEAEAMLLPMFEHFDLTWAKVDIAEPTPNTGFDAEALVAQWGLKIPVLYCTFKPVHLQWPFTEKDVLKFWENAFNEDN